MKTVLITGASGDIGKETVKRFLLEGYFVIAVYNNGRENLENLIKGLSEDYAQMTYCVKCDLSKSKDVNLLIENLKTNFKHIDCFVYNAGVDLYKLTTDTTEEEFDYVMNVNFKSAFLLSKYLLEGMVERKSGTITYVSSIWGEVGASMESVYSASKSALIGLTKSLSKEVAFSNVRVNCVSPGVIDTKMNDIFSNEEKQEIINDIPLRRFGTAKEVANVIYFLSGEASSYITGETLSVGGGYCK